MDLLAHYALAVLAAQTAGQLLLDRSSQLKTVTFADKSDVKLQADQDAESCIRNILTSSQLPIIGEEQGGDPSLLQEEGYYWLVDPLDGTFNYLRGQALCAVSIALMQGTQAILGVINHFDQNQLYASHPEQGLLCNGTPLQAQWAQAISEACLMTGIPAGMDKSTESMQSFAQLLQPYKKVRMVGSAAMALVFVASGQADVYIERSVKLWDVAAGLALVQAGGGIVHLQKCPSHTFAYNVTAQAPALKPPHL